MIDQDVFQIEWAILCERFNKEPSVVLASRYYQALSPEMTTEEFKAASVSVFRSREFFPRPDDFLEAVQGTAEEAAATDWELVERAMRGSTRALPLVSEAGRKALTLVGGLDVLRNMDIADIPFRRQEYFRLHPHAQQIAKREERLALPPMSDEAARLIRAAMPRLSGGEPQ